MEDIVMFEDSVEIKVTDDGCLFVEIYITGDGRKLEWEIKGVKETSVGFPTYIKKLIR